MRVWIVAQYAVSPFEAGGTRHFALSKQLVARGHQPVILASSFNHLTRKETRPGGGWQRQDIEGVQFVWIPSLPYGVDVQSRVRSMLYYTAQVALSKRVRHLPRPDVVIGSTPHIFAPFAARHLARAFRVPFLLEVRDLWPDSLVEVGEFDANHPAVDALRVLERTLYRTSDGVISLLPAAVNYFIDRGARPDSVAWIPNGVDLELFPPPVAASTASDFTLMYVGAHGPANALNTILDAAAQLRVGVGGTGFRIVLIGDGPEKENLRNRARSESLDAVEFRGSITRNQVPHVLSTADAFIVSLKRTDLYRRGISLNKIFDYLAAGRPIILASGAVNDPVAEAGAGISVPPEDAAAMASAVKRLLAMDPAERARMGERGRKYVERYHDFKLLAADLEALLCEVVAHKRPTPAVAQRALDVVGASTGLAVLGVPMLAVAALVRVSLGKPILYRQPRLGREGRVFEIYKFRTMHDLRGSDGGLLSDERRLTAVGRFLRRTSLDELPELLNVLKGDMSLAGPRPLLVQYLGRYSQFQARRHEVRPGITGWAQINGRNTLMWDDKFKLDVWYVDHRSFWIDLNILARTLIAVVRGHGVSADGYATMPEFFGPAPQDSELLG